MNFKQFKFHSHLFILRQVCNLSWHFQGHHTVCLQLCDSPTLCFGDTGESKSPFPYIIFCFAIIWNGLFYTCIYDIQIHSVNYKSILISSHRKKPRLNSTVIMKLYHIFILSILPLPSYLVIYKNTQITPSHFWYHLNI